MLHLTPESKILVATEPVDGRKQIDGLVALCCNHFQQHPNDGALYVFINRAKTSIKVLYYEQNGYWLGIKRLSRGRFTEWPNRQNSMTPIMAHELRLILKATLVIARKEG
jgi:hypothetical protein